MFVVGNLLGAVAAVLDIVLQLLMLVVLVNALLSWVRPDPTNPIVRALDRISDLVCDPIRYSVRLSEAPGYGQTIFEYAPRSPGAEDYQKLAERILGDGGS